MFTNKIKEKWWIITLFGIFIFSFILDIYVLTRYNLSYGRDGPFYDLQVLNILKTGLPASNDPPLVYYILAPFVLVSGNSFLGIKIGMAMIGSLMAFPAFLLTEMFSEKLGIGSKIPALLSAFMITVNIFYFQMIGDFMQNLVGVFFLLLLIYFAVKWLENPEEWKKYGTLAIVLLLCNIFTHIYTGILAVILFISLLLFNWVLISYKTGKVEMKGLKILGMVSILVIGGLAVLFAVYPYMFSKFTTVLSFLNTSSTSSSNVAGGNFVNPIIFLTVPFILGVIVTIHVLYNGLKEKIDANVISRKTLLAWIYLIMTIVLISLAVAPSVDSQYKSRFIELSFVPIALMVPLGLKFIENWLSKRYPSKKRLKLGLISLIAVVFALSSFYTATEEFSSMGPSITSDQYNSLVSLKENFTSNNINTNGIILVDDYHTGYWVEYVLGMQVETGNLSEIQKEYPNRSIYAVTLVQNSQSQLKGSSEYSWSPLLPYSFPFGGWNFSNSFNSTGGPKQFSKNMLGSPPGDLGNANGQNRSSTPPKGLGSRGQNDRSSPFNATGTGSDNAAGVGNGPNNGGSSSDMSGQNLNQIISNYGTLIFSGSNFKIYKIS